MNARLPPVFLVTMMLGLSLARGAGADEGVQAVFALVIGSNVSVDKDLPPLKYADDDAANYLDLFRVLGARTYLLSRLDDNTRRLHPQAAAEALEPRRAALEQVTAQIAVDVARAQQRGVDTVLYVAYAGHGNLADGEGYITLEDVRLTGGDLARLVARVPATRVHILIDACASYFLAYSRGPGGQRRPLSGFQDSALLAADPRVGLLLSTSSARESHEWDGFQAGVFSHEVQSGLYGAADADGDGRVSYREIAAFVSRANESIPNERFRPDVHTRAPRQSDTLVDLRAGLARRLEIDGAHAAHYFIEDSRGVRLVDLHNSERQPVRIVRPPPNGPLFVRRVEDDAEFVVPLSPEVVSLADVGSSRARVASRGAAHEAYGSLFALPFDLKVVESYVPPAIEDPARQERASSSVAPPTLRHALGWSAVGLGAIGAGIGLAFDLSALGVANGTSRTDSQSVASQRNARIADLNTRAAVSYVAGGALLATGLALLLWPDSHVVIAPLPTAAIVGYGGSF